MAHYIRYETQEGYQYVNSESDENIQAYGNDSRYPQFKKDLDAGVHTFEDFVIDADAEKSRKEKVWRNIELANTDIQMIQALGGEMGRNLNNIKNYRQALRDYPAQPDFPNGTRPSL